MLRLPLQIFLKVLASRCVDYFISQVEYRQPMYIYMFIQGINIHVVCIIKGMQIMFKLTNTVIAYNINNLDIFP